jgi:hypothetical protein
MLRVVAAPSGHSGGVDSPNAVAANTAAARAVACRGRLMRLAAHEHVGVEDVWAAQAALCCARHRAEAARRRLTARLLGASLLAAGARTCIAPASPDVATLRAATRELADRGLYLAYFGLGGNCEPLELDAFAHAALELPAEELARLAHAVWELTEL